MATWPGQSQLPVHVELLAGCEVLPLADAVADFALWPTKETHRQAKKLNTSFLDF